jgi:predicted phosphoribosyltransferase
MEAFPNRTEAGRLLANELGEYAGRGDVVVLGLPRGGVPVAHEVADALEAPLDVFVVRKLGVPGREELAMGAIASGGIRVLNQNVIEALGIPAEDVERVALREKDRLAEQEQRFREGRPPLALANKMVIIVDDGLATGASMRAAVQAVRAAAPAAVVVAVPTASVDAVSGLSAVADRVVAVITPADFGGVGAWYLDFSQVSDEEVRHLLRR